MSRRVNVDAGPILTIVGALVLLVSLFLDWYEPGVSAWTVFEVIDLLLAVSALGALVISLDLLVPGLLPLPRMAAAERIVMTAATVALVLVASQLLNHPPAAQHEGTMTGAWLALGGAALMVAGGIATMVMISLRLTVDRRHPGAVPPPATPPAAPPPPPRPGETQETRELP
jgi:hypothetical protein